MFKFLVPPQNTFKLVVKFSNDYFFTKKNKINMSKIKISDIIH